MTAPQAAATLGITRRTLVQLVYARKLRPEQPIGRSGKGCQGVGPSGWTFTAAEIERYQRARNESRDRQRSWNGARPKFSVEDAA